MMASLLDEFEGQVDYAYDGQHFVSRWQTYRTRKDRSLESEFAVEEPKVSSNQVVVKVVDIPSTGPWSFGTCPVPCTCRFRTGAV